MVLSALILAKVSLGRHMKNLKTAMLASKILTIQPTYYYIIHILQTKPVYCYYILQFEDFEVHYSSEGQGFQTRLL